MNFNNSYYLLTTKSFKNKINIIILYRVRSTYANSHRQNFQDTSSQNNLKLDARTNTTTNS